MPPGPPTGTTPAQDARADPTVPPDTSLLAPHTTLGLGGPARRLVRATTADEVVARARAADGADEPLLLVGGGSNLVIGDAGFAGTALLIDNTGHHVVASDDGSVVLHVEAGTDWDALVADTVADGLGGLECLSGIPGRTGATPVQNVGAYGVEVADVLVDVDLYARRTGRRGSVPAADLGLGYRTSRLKGDRNVDGEIVLGVRFRLTTDGLSAPVRYIELARALGVEPGARVPVADAREAVLGLRRGKGMVTEAGDPDSRSAGSFFMNPVVDEATAARVAQRVEAAGQVPVTAWPQPDGRVKLSAAALIERAGVPRGHPGPQAPVRVSTKHTLALTHRGGGTTDDLLALARDVRDRVDDAFGLLLQPEPVLVSCAL
ncbi:UDP-N-acetylmuramate dehydrogenase [Actinomycetospora cinnamomea]|uniref:UDP-N-acetylenolpyruvoylglucosamine reductase n=1 Tax=Actinomycetospora cinnamomea TaxID=663609 RepID=A0A2U1FCY5_9PSEU|nr:UDP-N-acetylmuramate dehydrogenase [Actinomycetospora cinnamomea]